MPSSFDDALDPAAAEIADLREKLAAAEARAAEAEKVRSQQQATPATQGAQQPQQQTQASTGSRVRVVDPYRAVVDGSHFDAVRAARTDEELDAAVRAAAVATFGVEPEPTLRPSRVGMRGR